MTNEQIAKKLIETLGKMISLDDKMSQIANEFVEESKKEIEELEIKLDRITK